MIKLSQWKKCARNIPPISFYIFALKRENCYIASQHGYETSLTSGISSGVIFLGQYESFRASPARGHLASSNKRTLRPPGLSHFSLYSIRWRLLDWDERSGEPSFRMKFSRRALWQGWHVQDCANRKGERKERRKEGRKKLALSVGCFRTRDTGETSRVVATRCN